MGAEQILIRRVIACALTVFFICVDSSAQAADLRWSGPEDCDWALQVRNEVETRIGGPLEAVEGIDFEVDVSRAAAREWRLTLLSIEQPSGERRTRELTGESCAEVADAAALAVAMAIRAKSEEKTAPETEPSGEQRPASPARPLTSSTAISRPQKRTPPAADSKPATVFAAAGVVADLGALPDLGIGAGLEAGVALDDLRLSALGSIFAPDETTVSGDRGGRFELWLVGALACVQRPLARFAVLGCAGYEIGVLSGRGTGVTDPRSQSATWHALRGELGAVLPIGAGFAGLIRAGAVLPLARQEFVLNGSEVVHRPSTLTARASALLLVDF